MTAASTAIATTSIAPIAIECIVLESTRKRPASEISTVTPDTATARPEVRIAVASAVSGSAPPCSSSR